MLVLSALLEAQVAEFQGIDLNSVRYRKAAGVPRTYYETVRRVVEELAYRESTMNRCSGKRSYLEPFS